MSSPKFAIMTADLLARKGGAAPSLFTPVHAAVTTQSDAASTPFTPAPWEPVKAATQAGPAPLPAADDADKPRRIMVMITHDELERLGIAAIKKGVSRHDIVRGALDSYFRKLAAELPQTCSCMANGNCCR